MTKTTLPRHVAIIMDGNGRWAKKRFLPRIAGHKAGVDAVREVVKGCIEKKIEALTLFAFSSENWRRPASEVGFLMDLFVSALERETKKLHEQNVKLQIMGDRSLFDEKLRQYMESSEALTQHNTGLKMVIAANYGGHWDITEAMRHIACDIEQGHLSSREVTPSLIQSRLSLPDLPLPDLFIRTSGEQRISNFMLWQLAYTELYFTDVLWPDFSIAELNKAFDFYARRERRFGYISEQLREQDNA